MADLKIGWKPVLTKRACPTSQIKTFTIYENVPNLAGSVWMLGMEISEPSVVILKNQTKSNENGTWQVHSGPWVQLSKTRL